MPGKSGKIAGMFLPSRGKQTRAGKRAVSAPEDNPSLQLIWDTVAMLPAGKVTTYGAVARAAGLPGRARLAGRALKTMPDGMNLPWHRVVGAGGRIVFPERSAQHREQARRLRSEGVVVTNGRVAAQHLSDLEEL